MISVIIPVGDLTPSSRLSRLRSLQYAIDNFYNKQRDIDLEVIIVEQSLDYEFMYLPFIGTPTAENKRVSFVAIPIYYHVYNKSWCINVGVNKSKGDIIVIAESDMFVNDPLYFSKMEAMLKYIKWAYGWDQLYYTDWLDKREMLKGNSIDIQHGKIVAPVKGLAEGGFVAFRKDFFMDIGMSNEYMEELGGMDNEILTRARHLSGNEHKMKALVYHLWHEQTPKSDRPTRKINKQICRDAEKDPQKMIDELKTLNQGNIAFPVTLLKGYNEKNIVS